MWRLRSHRLEFDVRLSRKYTRDTFAEATLHGAVLLTEAGVSVRTDSPPAQ